MSYDIFLDRELDKYNEQHYFEPYYATEQDIKRAVTELVEQENSLTFPVYTVDFTMLDEVMEEKHVQSEIMRKYLYDNDDMTPAAREYTKLLEAEALVIVKEAFEYHKCLPEEWMR